MSMKVKIVVIKREYKNKVVQSNFITRGIFIFIITMFPTIFLQ